MFFSIELSICQLQGKANCMGTFAGLLHSGVLFVSSIVSRTGKALMQSTYCGLSQQPLGGSGVGVVEATTRKNGAGAEAPAATGECPDQRVDPGVFGIQWVRDGFCLQQRPSWKGCWLLACVGFLCVFFPFCGLLKRKLNMFHSAS